MSDAPSIDVGDALEGRDAWERYAHRLEARLAAFKALADGIERGDIYDDHDHCVAAIRAALGSPS